MTQEALKLALECAERCEAIDGMYSWSATITAIKEALAEHAMQQRIGRELLQEPLELCQYGQDPKSCTSNPMDCQCAIDASLAQTQEPVGVVHHKLTSTLGADYEQVAVFVRPVEPGTKLYTTQPQRTWVGLTDEEIDDLWESTASYYNTHDFARAIEAKLKEKNCL